MAKTRPTIPEPNPAEQPLPEVKEFTKTDLKNKIAECLSKVKQLEDLKNQQTKISDKITLIEKELRELGYVTATTTTSTSTKPPKEYVIPTEAHIPTMLEFIGNETKSLTDVKTKMNFHHKACQAFCQERPKVFKVTKDKDKKVFIAKA
jgi:Zn-dependent oligopeptidase